jgi:hypothetical protein
MRMWCVCGQLELKLAALPRSCMVIDQQTSLVLHALCAWSFPFSLCLLSFQPMVKHAHVPPFWPSFKAFLWSRL